MSARMGLLAQLSLRMDAIPAHQLIKEHRAEVLREAADAVTAQHRSVYDDAGQRTAEGILRAAKLLRGMADVAEQGERDTAPAATSTPQPAEARIVAYRNPDRPSVLLCREHGDGWWGMTPLTSEDLPDGGTCTYGDPADPDDVCGRDVLIVTEPGEKDTREGESTQARRSADRLKAFIGGARLGRTGGDR